LREPGSGTRDILEHALYNQNLSIYDFKSHMVIGNSSAIKQLCQQNAGITFIYREAVKDQLLSGTLKEIAISNFTVNHPFNFVYLKNTPNQVQLEYWFDKIIRLR